MRKRRRQRRSGSWGMSLKQHCTLWFINGVEVLKIKVLKSLKKSSIYRWRHVRVIFLVAKVCSMFVLNNLVESFLQSWQVLVFITVLFSQRKIAEKIFEHWLLFINWLDSAFEELAVGLVGPDNDCDIIYNLSYQNVENTYILHLFNTIDTW